MGFLRLLVLACFVTACVSQEGGSGGTGGGSGSGSGSGNGNFNFPSFPDFTNFMNMFGGLSNFSQLMTDNNFMQQLTNTFGADFSQQFTQMMANFQNVTDISQLTNAMQGFQRMFPNASMTDFMDFSKILGNNQMPGFEDLMKNLQSITGNRSLEDMTKMLGDLGNMFNMTNMNIPDMAKILGSYGNIFNSNDTVAGFNNFIKTLQNVFGPNSTFDFNNFANILGQNNPDFTNIMDNFSKMMPKNFTLGDMSKVFDEMQKSFNINNLADFSKFSNIFSSMFSPNMSMADMTNNFKFMEKYMKSPNFTDFTQMMGNFGNMFNKMGENSGMMGLMDSFKTAFGSDSTLSMFTDMLTKSLNSNNTDVFGLRKILEGFNKNGSSGSNPFTSFMNMLGGTNSTKPTNPFSPIIDTFSNILPIKPPSKPSGGGGGSVSGGGGILGQFFSG